MKKVDAEIQDLLVDNGAFPASIAPNAATFLGNLILTEKPSLTVEVGCCHGFSTLHIGKALQELGGTRKLVSFDLAPQGAAERIRRAGLESFVEFIAGNSSKEGKRFLADDRQVIDFLFIDGDHTRRGCLRDAEAFLPHLKIGGVLMLHDIYPERCGWLGPRFLIECLNQVRSANGQACFSIEEISDLDQYGIAVCRKLCELPPGKLKSNCFSDWYKTSRLVQFVEIAHFEGNRTPWQMFTWGCSKLSRIARHW